MTPSIPWREGEAGAESHEGSDQCSCDHGRARVQDREPVRFRLWEGPRTTVVMLVNIGGPFFASAINFPTTDPLVLCERRRC